jgi:hypothetical protein
MPQRKQWKKTLKNKIAKRAEFIDNVKELSDLAVKAEEQNKEDKAKLSFVENMPESILIERGEPLFLIEKHDEKKLDTYLPSLTQYTTQAKKFVFSSDSTGTSSAYMDIANTFRVPGAVLHPYTASFTPEDAQSVEVVYNTFSDLAEEKSKKENLPPRLNKINEKLGDAFILAVKNYEKSQIELTLVHQSAMDLRAILQQLWGGLVALARKKNAQTLKNHTEMRKDADRIIVAGCLIDDEIEKKKLISSLDIIARLYSDLSTTNFGKNILGEDKEKLAEIYKLWILAIDDTTNSLFSNIEFFG